MIEILLTLVVIVLAIWVAILEVRLKEDEEHIKTLAETSEYELNMINNVNERTTLNSKAIQQLAKCHNASVYGKVVQDCESVREE